MKEEIIIALRDTHPWKAAGPDGVYAGTYKHFNKEVIPILLKEYNLMWNNQKSQDEWFTSGRTILFLKDPQGKGDPTKYRPTTMLNSLYKLLSSILGRRIMHSMMKVGNWDRDQQALNKSRRGCLDAHLISEVAIKMCRKVTRNTLNITYIDFQKAYDSVSHIGLLKILEKP